MKQNKSVKLLQVVALLAALLCLAVAGLSSAEEAGTVLSYTFEIPGEEDYSSSQDPLEQYIYKTMNWTEMYVPPTPRFRGSTAGSRLSGKAAWLYQEMKEKLTDVAAGNLQSTEFEFPLNQVFDDVAYTAEELGVSSLESQEARTAFGQNMFNTVSGVVDALLFDCPYELYWYDKTIGCGMSIPLSIENNTLCLANYTTGNVQFYFRVAAAYSLSGETRTCQFNTAKAQAVQSAAAKAQQIVNSNIGKSDYGKLLAYKNAICSLTEYNHEAADNNATLYGDPWQLVYVFDGNPNTKVVCEGYSKAFQYLYDISDFSNTSVISVSGVMSGEKGSGDHMWNIVTLNGVNYMADITNSDVGKIGQDGELFLTGYTEFQTQNGINWYFYIIDNQNWAAYTYDDDTVELFGGEHSVLDVTANDFPVPEHDEDDLSRFDVLDLPDDLTRIEDNAFENGAFEAVVIPDGCTYIGHGAFSNCANLIYVSRPANTVIEEDSFAGSTVWRTVLRNTTTSQ